MLVYIHYVDLDAAEYPKLVYSTVPLNLVWARLEKAETPFNVSKIPQYGPRATLSA